MATSLSLVFLRRHGEVLVRETDTPESGTDSWHVPAVTGEGEPADLARSTLADYGVDPDDVVLVRRGEPLDRDGTDPDRVRPLLFDCGPDALPDEGEAFRWIPPTELPSGGTERHAYERVRPTVETLEADRTHGSTTLSIRALETLRDEAALLADGEGEFPGLSSLAGALVTARPAMTAVRNRVLRAVAGADGSPDPATVVETAHDGIRRAREADQDTAAAAAERVDGARVATLSRSGTVISALTGGNPTAVLVAESRPGREGIGVAEHLCEQVETTLTNDAAFPGQLLEWDADVVLVGADSILADGRVVNKVGTRPAATVASGGGAQVVVAAASDKVSHGTAVDPERREPDELYDGAAPLAVSQPTFEVTPPEYVDEVVTERGTLTREEIEAVADEHATLARWLDDR